MGMKAKKVFMKVETWRAIFASVMRFYDQYIMVKRTTMYIMMVTLQPLLMPKVYSNTNSENPHLFLVHTDPNPKQKELQYSIGHYIL